MSFNFGKFVERHTRTLFSFIVVTMVLPLVLWGYMGKTGTEKEEDKSDAGVLYGTIHVSKTEYNRHIATATASYWSKKYSDPMTMMMMRYGQQPKPPTADELSKQAWEDIILLREAKANGITGSETETLMQMREIYQRFVPQGDYRDDIMHRIATELYKVTFEQFQLWCQDNVVIEKLLTLISDSEFADYDKVYERVMGGHTMAKVWYAALDPKDFQRDIKAPTTDEILAYYGKNKEKYKVPAKVQVSYLLVDADEFKKKEPEPSEADVKKYYEDFKMTEFAKPHHHDPGEEHKDEEKSEAKPFDEVKGLIPDKIKQKAADKKAAEIMSKVDVELGAITTANNNKYPDDVFDQLKSKFKGQGVELTHDITNSFDPKGVEEVEKIVGANSNLATWAFDPALKPGEVSQKVKTGKGVALFRLQKKIDSVDPGITERTREIIVKELQKEQLKKKVQTLGNNLMQEINTKGMMAARAAYPRIEWKLTRYFKTDSMDLGIEDSSLAGGISQQLRGQSKAGKAQTMSGAMLRNPDKADWNYVLYVEDIVELPPDDVGTQFTGSRRGLDEEARRKYRAAYIEDTVKTAAVQVDASLKNSAK